MNPIDIEMLAMTFNVVSVAIGVPSVATLLLHAVTAIRRRLGGGPSARAAAATNFGPNPDAILLMLQGMTKAIGGLGRAGGALGRLLLRGLAIVACLGVVLAGVSWWTGYGLRAHAPWALFSASVLVVLALVLSLVLTLSLRGIGRVSMLALLVFCVLCLHTLWTGYNPAAL